MCVRKNVYAYVLCVARVGRAIAILLVVVIMSSVSLYILLYISTYQSYWNSCERPV